MRVILLITLVGIFTQAKANNSYLDSNYNAAYKYIREMLNLKNEPSFKKAVFVTENAFYEGKLSYTIYNEHITYLTTLAKDWMQANLIGTYKYEDSINLYKNIALFRVIRDTIKVSISKDQWMNILPYEYNFDDVFGENDWGSTFVTALIKTRKGNCHSLTYLYKILADELNATCWLSFAPNHIFIKNRCSAVGWYNTELTSGQFPVDAWIMASGYVPPDAVRSGIYMDTLSTQQAIANCALDLAKGYERKYKTYTDSFIIKCCDLTLKCHPLNINAIIYKAETLKKMYLIYQKEKPALAETVYLDMEKLYMQALDWGYKEMPEKMYREWLLSVSRQKDKYLNKKVSGKLRNK